MMSSRSRYEPLVVAGIERPAAIWSTCVQASHIVIFGHVLQAKNKAACSIEGDVNDDVLHQAESWIVPPIWWRLAIFTKQREKQQTRKSKRLVS